jgi:Alginate export
VEAEAQEQAQRPSIMFNRWQEDWSVPADPSVPREAFDALKYIPLDAADPKTYLSFGANLRERFEANDAVNFGVGGIKPQEYVISRLEGDADLRIADQFQAFVQLESAFAPGKTILTPVDQDRATVEQAFVALTEPVDDGTFKLRIGRQQIGFDLQRFISVRDGPNLRQSYDAIWADYEKGVWRFTGFYSQPVQNRNLRAFDDTSSGHLTYGGARAERNLGELGSLSVTVSRFAQDAARFPSVTGNERRTVADVHAAGKTPTLDWDVEAMGQTGTIANEDIRAWAFGSRAGYTFGDVFWKPRLGLQLDAASGNNDPHSHTLGTFNPLFPNGYYVTLSGYTGYTNFIHLKPSLTLTPAHALTVMVAAAAQWRETTSDAVYTQPDIPVAGTVGHGGQYTGTYFQTRVDWQVTPHIATALEAVRFNVAEAIRSVGGHDGNYLGLEFRLGW